MEKITNILLIAISGVILTMMLIFALSNIRSAPTPPDASDDYSVASAEYDYEPLENGEYDGSLEFRERFDLDALMEQYRRIEQFNPDDFFEDDFEIDIISHSHLPIIEGLQRADNGILIGSIEFDEPKLLKAASNVINLRSEPSSESDRVTTISLGQVVEASRVVEGWYEVTVLPGMFTGFIRSDLLLMHDENIRYFAHPRVETIVFRGNEYQVTLVDVRTIIPDLVYDMVFATPNNFTGETLYARDVPLLQLGTAEKLREAQEIFARDGFRIKLFDAYRPVSVSAILYDIVQDRRYVAPPGASTHNRAAAVDITLVDRYGNELEMPSPMHTFNETAHRNSRTMSTEARANMDYLTSVMVQVGFTTITSEWWHFNDSNSRRYPPMDFSFRDLSFFSLDFTER